MYELTELYKVNTNDSYKPLKRPVLVNPALITFVRDYGEFRRVCFGGAMADYIEVEESMEHIGAWVK